MDDEIEKYLVAKLTNAIEKVEEAKKSGSVKSKVAKLLPPRTASASGPRNLTKLTRDRLYNLNNLLAEWQIQSEKQNRYPFESNIFDYFFARKIKIPEEDQKKLPNEAKKTNPEGTNGIPVANFPTPQPSNYERNSSIQTEETRWSTRAVDPKKVHGIDDVAMSLQRWLVKEKGDPGEFKAIGIVGMRGIGKTTLCQIVFDMEEVKNHFLPRIWVCASRKPEDDKDDNRKETVKRMLQCLGVEDEIINYANEKHGLKGLLYALRLQLMGKKYLIVLDDVWTTEKYKDFYSFVAGDEKCSEKLAYGLPKGYGGTVIITSRTEELAKKMVGEENLHRIMPLSKESCWEIFKDSFGEADESLKGKITDKCDGLPLAAKMMGQIAKEQIAEIRRGSQ
ncbi:Disease resistance protein [Actinidia chinensis var. chinensis]|uniref:Disease resistance protein n=1 Tax=Actinidia chinensis var. chinensis TaxID=1590841 RepID=A0A2R6QLM1_ACTCC|nr:Disease resistance protein [Actinidia chinensis var. chinensis]